MEKVNVKERIDRLEALVEELLKDSPKESKVQKQMEDLDIPYSPDPVERINRVLAALHPHNNLDFEGES